MGLFIRTGKRLSKHYIPVQEPRLRGSPGEEKLKMQHSSNWGIGLTQQHPDVRVPWIQLLPNAVIFWWTANALVCVQCGFKWSSISAAIWYGDDGNGNSLSLTNPWPLYWKRNWATRQKPKNFRQMKPRNGKLKKLVMLPLGATGVGPGPEKKSKQSSRGYVHGLRIRRE